MPDNKPSSNMPLIIGGIVIILCICYYCFCLLSGGGGGYYWYSSTPAEEQTQPIATPSSTPSPVTETPSTNVSPLISGSPVSGSTPYAPIDITQQPPTVSPPTPTPTAPTPTAPTPTPTPTAPTPTAPTPTAPTPTAPTPTAPTPTAPTPTTVALDCTKDQPSAVTYYNTLGEWKGVYTMSPILNNKVDASNCDIGYNYIPVGQTTSSGMDRRRFTYNWDGSKWVASAMGANDSGKTVNLPSAPTPSTTTSINTLKYGNRIKIKAIPKNTIWGGYLSPCGSASGTNCGFNVTLRPDAQYNSNGGDSSGLRNWIILPAVGNSATTGSSVKYGDGIQLKAVPTNTSWGGILSVCKDMNTTGCGINVSTITDTLYNSSGGDASLLRTWIIVNPTGTTGTYVNFGDTIRIMKLPSLISTNIGGIPIPMPLPGGYLSPCGTNDTVCGIAVTLRPDATYTTEGGDSSKLRDWVIEKVAETFDGNIGYQTNSGYQNYTLTGNAFDGIINDFDNEYNKWNMIYRR